MAVASSLMARTISQLSDAERTRMRKRKIGFVFQKFNLLPTLDARSNIEIALDIAGDGESWIARTSSGSPNCWASASG